MICNECAQCQMEAYKNNDVSSNPTWFECEKCGSEDLWPNNKPPKSCPKCSKGTCQRCGTKNLNNLFEAKDTNGNT